MWLSRFLVVLVVFALCMSAEAQQSGKIPRIGVLLDGEVSLLESFRQGLRDLGYIEDKNILIEYRFVKGNPDRISALAADLIDKKVKLILTAGTARARAIQQVTVVTPIVLAFSGDPVAGGVAASLARPGGNVTGLSMISPEVSGKRLELLKEAAPKISRMGVLWNRVVPENIFDFRTTEVAAQAIRLKIESLEVRKPEDLERNFSLALRRRISALIVIGGGVTNREQKRIVAFELKNRLPTVHELLTYAESGGLMAYGVNQADMFRRAAKYVDKILKGAKPAALPIEQPTKFELVINLKTAKQIGFTIPQTVLYRADKLIK
jgi:putative tryptophan/tyrosine transport system substrate-binding protein